MNVWDKSNGETRWGSMTVDERKHYIKVTMENPRYRGIAVYMKANIDWSKCPHLSEIFENRPAVNKFWIDMAIMFSHLCDKCGKILPTPADESPRLEESHEVGAEQEGN